MSAVDRMRAKLDRAVAPFLSPGETIQASVPVATLHPAWLIALFALIGIGGSTGYFLGGAIGGALAGLLYALLNRNRVIVFTDHRIVVMNSSRFGPAKVQGLGMEFPRTTLVGPIRGRLIGRLIGRSARPARLKTPGRGVLSGQLVRTTCRYAATVGCSLPK